MQKRDKYSILIVEDEAIVAMDLESKLIGMGYDVVAIVDNGPDALMHAVQSEVDLILLDINIIGDWDGIDTAKMILNKKSVPIVFLTAYSNPEFVERAKAVTPYGYILKPFQIRELEVTLDIAFHKHQEDKKLMEKSVYLEDKIQLQSAELNQMNDSLKKEIEERRKVQSDLNKQNDHYHYLVEHLATGLITVTKHGDITEYNLAFAKLFNHLDKPLKGEFVSDILGNNLWSDVQDSKGVWEKEYQLSIKKQIAYIRVKVASGADANYVILVDDITEQKNMEAALTMEKQKQKEALIEAVESERVRFANDLHDGLGQKLTGIKLMLNVLSRDGIESEVAKSTLKEIKTITEELTAEVNEISNNLTPVIIEDYGFVAALHKLANDIEGLNMLDVKLDVSDDYLRIPLIEELNLYRITQEATNNTLKHAAAKHLSLNFKQYSPTNYQLEIVDDGHGFADNEGYTGNGVRTIKERVEAIDAKLAIESTNSGTKLIISK